MGEATGKLKETWRTLGPRGQLGVAASGLLVLVTLFFLFQMAGKASYTTLTSGLEAADSAQVAKALDSAGIQYQLRNGGTEIAVVSGSESKARLALASKNLPSGGHVGFELFDKKSLGQTDFQQKVQYQRALEGEIARTIEQIQGVTGADVQLVIPDDALFLADQTKASASVLVRGGTNLDASTISGIAHLVSSAVKGLNANSVTITDETGTMLWPRSGGGGAGGDSSPSLKLEAEQRYASQLSSQINAMLVSTLGANKAQVRIHADLNVDQSTLEKVTYAKTGTPLTTKKDLETLKSEGTAATTPSGTASNIPSYSAGSGKAGTSDYNRQAETTEFGVDKTVSRTVVAPGSVNKIDVALIVDESVPAAQVAALQKSVAAMAGVNAARGDTLAVTTLAFAEPPKAASPAAGGLPIPPAMLGLLKWVGVLLGSGAFLFLLRKNLKRREGEGVAIEPTWLREIERAVPVGALEAGTATLDISADPEAERRHQLKGQVQELARGNPEQVALQINQWMREG